MLLYWYLLQCYASGFCCALCVFVNLIWNYFENSFNMGLFKFELNKWNHLYVGLCCSTREDPSLYLLSQRQRRWQILQKDIVHTRESNLDRKRNNGHFTTKQRHSRERATPSLFLWFGFPTVCSQANNKPVALRGKNGKKIARPSPSVVLHYKTEALVFIMIFMPPWQISKV